MSAEQATLGEFEQAETSAHCDRPKCNHPNTDGSRCKNPVIPIEGVDVCTVHLGGSDDENDSYSSDGEADRPVWERQSSELLGGQ